MLPDIVIILLIHDFYKINQIIFVVQLQPR